MYTVQTAMYCANLRVTQMNDIPRGVRCDFIIRKLISILNLIDIFFSGLLPKFHEKCCGNMWYFYGIRQTQNILQGEGNKVFLFLFKIFNG